MKRKRLLIKVVYTLLPSLFLLLGGTANAQSTWFADGYHGGVYGHYPLYVTQLMVDTLNRYQDWRINLEIEPETWDTVQAKDPRGYAAFQKLFEDQSTNGRIEYINPSYAQSYLFPVSGESIIRQFQYGIKKLKQHFPSATFTTYSSEEPCFTSALPQILKSLGITNAVLKNPNTCWGGYIRAYGGETVNWIGPDGTNITTIPRYASEALERNSTWQTTAWANSKEYITAAFNQGIQKPVGMCLQDAGWKNGRWLGKGKSNTTTYTIWRNYFANVTAQRSSDDWRVSQEDILVSLVWGSQIMQRIAQQVRVSENKMTDAEKMASLAKLYANAPYPADNFDRAWRPLLLSQHHDCWIVPYNNTGNKGLTWAGEVKEWTEYTNQKSEDIVLQSADALTKSSSQFASTLAVYNTLGYKRKELISVPLAMVPDDMKKSNALQVSTDSTGNARALFPASVPPSGYTVFDVSTIKNEAKGKAVATIQKNGSLLLETDVYKMIVDPAKGGAIASLIAKKMGNKEFVSQAKKESFNSLRGNFYTDGGLIKSVDSKATVSILENGPFRIKVAIKGTIASHQYRQTIQLAQGDDIIDCNLHIDYNGNLRVGEDYKQSSGFDLKDLHKAFYNDTDKLITVFPLALQNQKVYKDAPFDVTESRLQNTFFNRWDSIKNNIILNWVDVTDGEGKYGAALLTDHTTSYEHGENFPLGLTVQYAGVGLWARNYKTDSATNIHYALIPHKGKWDAAKLNAQTERWNHPVIVMPSNETAGMQKSLLDISQTGWQITSMTYEGADLLVRLYNAEGSSSEQTLLFNCTADKAELVELNDKVRQTFAQTNSVIGKTIIRLAIPRFGVRTIRLVNAKG